jgi:hypothetical protein
MRMSLEHASEKIVFESLKKKWHVIMLTGFGKVFKVDCDVSAVAIDTM